MKCQFIAAITTILIVADCSVLVVENTNRIPGEFVDKVYRIERGFVPPVATANLLDDLLFQGVPTEDEEDQFPVSALKKIGDAGQKIAEQHDIQEYAEAMQNFTKPEHHMHFDHSLVYYMEHLRGASRQRTNEIVSDFAAASILEDGLGTVHLYMSAPGTAALDNHTDSTDIVVLQLDGVKEWTLCTAKERSTTDADNVPTGEPSWLHQIDSISHKLNSCSTYHTEEMDQLDCHRTMLLPGDVLFLPRHMVHSARALSETYSAHLTFGYSENDMCYWNTVDDDSSSRQGSTLF